MFTNNLKLDFRNLRKHKLQSAILIGGLTLGMAACILLLQYVSYELSFDSFHSKSENIYRIVNERIQNGTTVQKGTITYPTVGPALKEEFPEVRNATRIAYSTEVMLTLNDKIEPTDECLWVDEHFFEVFDFELLASEDLNLFNETNELVLTRSVADRYFPQARGNYEKIIGQEIIVGQAADPYKIVAVCENVPANSTLQFDFLGSYKSIIRYWGEGAGNSWTWSDYYHYLELEPDTDVSAFEAKLVDFSQRHFRGTEVTGSEEVFTLQHLAEAHLNSNTLEYEIGKTSNGNAVWSLLIIAFFILVIAWINYVNLSSVKAIERSKEVGVRKVIGATRGQLVRQFLAEALTLNLVSFGLAISLVQILNPWFATNFDLEASSLSFFSSQYLNGYLMASLLGMMLLGVLVSGAYPAWLLSSPHVSSVLKGIFTRKLKGAGIRKGLVIFQFMMSIALIAATWLVSQQINFMSKQDLGFNIDQVMILEGPEMTGWDSTFINKMNSFKGALEQFPGISSAATSGRSPGERMGRTFGLRKTGEGAEGQSYTSNILRVDYDFARTYDITPLTGRFFRKEDHNDDPNQIENLLLNESAVRMLGYADANTAVGQQLVLGDRDWNIVGVLPNFHQLSLHHTIEPIMFLPMYGTGNAVSIKLGAENIDATITQVRSTFNDFFPGNTFRYTFADERFQQLYDADQRFGNILSFFTLMTILIACFGLFGLASYTTFLRTKEIGVRKVLGASAVNIVTMLSKDFIRLVLIALLIAAPLTWFTMDYWLNNYAYRIDVPWWVFVLAGVGTLLITFLTVGLQGVRAAMANPVESLRSE